MSALHQRLSAQAEHRAAVEAEKAEKAEPVEIGLADILAAEPYGVIIWHGERDYAEVVADACRQQIHEEGPWLELLPRNPHNRRPKDPERKAPAAAAKKTGPTLIEENEAYLREIAAEEDFPDTDVEGQRLQRYARRLFWGDAEVLMMRAVAAVTGALAEWYRVADLRQREEERADRAKLPRTREERPTPATPDEAR